MYSLNFLLPPPPEADAATGMVITALSRLRNAFIYHLLNINSWTCWILLLKSPLFKNQRERRDMSIVFISQNESPVIQILPMNSSDWCINRHVWHILVKNSDFRCTFENLERLMGEKYSICLNNRLATGISLQDSKSWSISTSKFMTLGTNYLGFNLLNCHAVWSN